MSDHHDPLAAILDGQTHPAYTRRGMKEQQQQEERYDPSEAFGVRQPANSLAAAAPGVEAWDDSLPPTKGMAGFMHRVFGAKVRPNQAELIERKRARDALERQHQNTLIDAKISHSIFRPKRRSHGYCGFFTVASEKGGVGKTTISALLAYEFSQVRQSEPIGIADLNPDRGSLARRMGVTPRMTIRDLINYAAEIPGRYPVFSFLTQVPSTNVWVLGGDTNPERRDQTHGEDVRTIYQKFSPDLSLAILDNGTGITHSALEGSLSISHGMTLVVDNTEDAYDFIDSTLLYLERNGYTGLRQRVVITIMDKVPSPESPMFGELYNPVSASNIRDRFLDKVREVIVVPFDPVLARSGPINFPALAPETRRAVRSLAAVLMDDLQS